jgi:hypothetical protein
VLLLRLSIVPAPRRYGQFTEFCYGMNMAPPLPDL